MNGFFSDFEDLAYFLDNGDREMVEMALQIIYLKGKIEGYTESILEKGNDLPPSCVSLRKKLDNLILAFSDRVLGLV